MNREPDVVPKLSVHGLRKRYPNGVLANDDVSLQVAPAEVHAILGENGAGKSTLLKMLYGLEAPDAGHIELDGRRCRFQNPAQAIAAGVGLVPQHPQLLPSMTVAENIVLGTEPRRAGLLDIRRAQQETLALSQRYGLTIDPQAPVAALAAGQQQRVEILKALRRGARLLLLDEPSALLGPQETQELFASLKALAGAQLTVVLITHKMAEVRQVCDRFTVLRGGRVVGQGRAAQFDDESIAGMIVGRPLHSARVVRVDARGRAPRVQARNLSLARPRGRPELWDVSFDIAAGEILGIAGVEGNGQDRLADVLSGLCAPTGGSACIDGRVFTGRGVHHARQARVGWVPEDRLHGGVAPSLSLADNGMALDYRHAPLSRWGLLRRDTIRQRARRLIEQFDIAVMDDQAAAGTLSGGNMQKLVVGRELLARPVFLIASQPTRGVDVGATQALRRAIVALRDQGAAVLLLSADLDEIFELSDRMAVLFEGRLVAHFMADTVSPPELGRCMTGMASASETRATLASGFSVRAEDSAP